MTDIDNVPMRCDLVGGEGGFSILYVTTMNRDWDYLRLSNYETGRVRLTVWWTDKKQKFDIQTTFHAPELHSLLTSSAAPNVIIDALLEHPDCPNAVHQLATQIVFEYV